MPGYGQEASQLERTQAPYNCQVNSRFLAAHRCPIDIVDNLASFLRGRHPKTVIFRYYSQEQKKNGAKLPDIYMRRRIYSSVFCYHFYTML